MVRNGYQDILLNEKVKMFTMYMLKNWDWFVKNIVINCVSDILILIFSEVGSEILINLHENASDQSIPPDVNDNNVDVSSDSILRRSNRDIRPPVRFNDYI